ncbi:Hypothetical protein D9617_16g013450 [Elsinoe fawcettii]|nr:Hypothetical protein D9617_16g013450 [Elsinoe fawcettii]
MSRPKILIIGCGAVGLAQGYHLSFGADITYLVRPGRKPAFKAPKQLYDYKKDTLRTFESYRVIENPRDVADEEFFCVFDTLDGATARSESGHATLKAVGEVIRDHPNTFVVYDAVGLDIEKYYASTMGISRDRLLLGLSMLAHQPTDSISIPPSANRDAIARADMLYSCTGGKGLQLSKSNAAHATAFQKVYKVNDMLDIGFLPNINEELLLAFAIPMLVGWHVHGWGPFHSFVDDAETWNMTIQAQVEILALPRYGWLGYLLSWVMGSWLSAKINFGIEKSSLPLQYHEFNKFHHGAKVLKQDIMLLEELLADGEKHKHKMTSLRALVKAAHAVEVRK